MKPAQPVTSALATRPPPRRATIALDALAPVAGPGAGTGARRGRGSPPRGASRAPRAARRSPSSSGSSTVVDRVEVAVAAAHDVGGVGREVERGRARGTSGRSRRPRCRRAPSSSWSTWKSPCAGTSAERRPAASAREPAHERVEARRAGRAAPRRSASALRARGGELALGGRGGQRARARRAAARRPARRPRRPPRAAVAGRRAVDARAARSAAAPAARLRTRRVRSGARRPRSQAGQRGRRTARSLP